MAGDQYLGGSAPPPETHSSSLFGHAMDSIKHGASVVRDTTVSVVKKGVQEGQEVAHSPTTHKIIGQVTEAGKNALHKGQEISQSPTAQHIEGQVAVAGKQIAHDHVNKVNGVIAAGRNGDVNGVIRNGLPLASEVLMGPAATALMIGKDKGGQIIMDNVPAEHRDTVKKLKDATDLATSKKNLPNLIIQGTEHSGKY